MVKALLSDNNIQGHVQILANILEGPEWRGVWSLLKLELLTFGDLGLPAKTPDSDLWQLCQEQEMILITANRNADDPNSLENTIRNRNTAGSLPVFTIANPDQILYSRDYAGRVVEHMLDYLIDIENYRGTGRLYLP